MGIGRDSRHKRRLTGGRRPIHQKKRKYELARQSSETKMGTKRVTEVRVRGGNIKYRALRLETGNFAWGSECTTRRAKIVDVVYNASNNELIRTKTLVKNAIILVDAAPFRQWFEQHYGLLIGKVKRDKAAEPKVAEAKDAEKPKDAAVKKDDKKEEDKKDDKNAKKDDKAAKKDDKAAKKDDKAAKKDDKAAKKDDKPAKKDDKSAKKDDKKSSKKDAQKDAKPAKAAKAAKAAKKDDKGKKDAPAKRSKSVLKKLQQRNAEHKLDDKLSEQFSSGSLLACIASRPGQSGRCDGYLLEGDELVFYQRKLQKKK